MVYTYTMSENSGSREPVSRRGFLKRSLGALAAAIGITTGVTQLAENSSGLPKPDPTKTPTPTPDATATAFSEKTDYQKQNELGKRVPGNEMSQEEFEAQEARAKAAKASSAALYAPPTETPTPRPEEKVKSSWNEKPIINGTSFPKPATPTPFKTK